ncbi:MAG: hypothetical protein AMXMBFR64_32330 [Myxococcales bacterium]
MRRGVQARVGGVVLALCLGGCGGDGSVGRDAGVADAGGGDAKDTVANTVLDATVPGDVGERADGAVAGPDGGGGGSADVVADTADVPSLSDAAVVDGGAADAGDGADHGDSGDSADGENPGDGADAEPWEPDPTAGHLDTGPLGEAVCVSVTGGSGAKLATGIARLKEAGVRTVRSILTWSSFEPSKGSFSPAALESHVTPYTDAGIDVIGVLAFGNPWACSDPAADSYYPPDDPADFANYVTAAITHLGPLVTRYEVWNEQNAGYRFWKPATKGDPAAYGTLLKAAVAAGRAACPTCQFAYGGPFFHSMIIDGHIPFLQQTYAAHPDLSAHFDAMAMHPYPFYPPQAAPEGPPEPFEWPFWTMVDAVRQVMADHDAGDRPIWVTEVGWPVFWSVTEELQAAYLVRGFLHLVALDAVPVCWYTLFDKETTSVFPAEDFFGLLTSGVETGTPEPKPVFHALAQLGGRFGEYRLVRDLHAAKLVPPGAWGFELSGPNGDRWWAVWAHPGTEVVTLPGPPLQVLDQLGGELAIVGVEQPVTALPVFVQVE